MGIRVDFLIKHVRPVDMEAWQLVCQDRGPGSLVAWLLANGVAQADVDHALHDWAAVALVDVHAPENHPLVIRAAQEISQARWSTLYNTDYSTIMFLNAPLLKELSFVSSEKRGKAFVFDPHESIPLAVTINRLRQPPAVVQNASGAAVAADANGDCCHLDGLIEDESP